MKIFVQQTTNPAFNCYLIGDSRLTVFTFVEAETRTDDEGKPTDPDPVEDSAVAAFLSAHGDSFGPSVAADLIRGVAGSQLKAGLKGFYDCVARQTLDFAEDGKTPSEERLGIGERSDYASWVFPNAAPYSQPYNRFCETAWTKAGTRRMTSRDGHFSAQLCVPFADSAITDETNSLLLKPGALGYRVLGLGSDVEITEVTLDELRSHGGGWDPFPSVSLDCADSCGEDGMTVSVAVVDATGTPVARDCTVYIECDAGYLSRRKVAVKAGAGTAKFLPLGLDAGDEVVIKAGFKIFSGLAERTIHVV